MATINVPTRDDVSPANQALFDTLKKSIGTVPNLYATLAHSDTALGTYLALQNAKSSIAGKAREVVNLVVSQVNACEYCLAAHTALGRKAGATSDEMAAAQMGESADPKTAAALRFALKVVNDRAQVNDADVQSLRDVGFDDGAIVEILAHVALNLFTNYVNVAFAVPVDFPSVKLRRA